MADSIQPLKSVGSPTEGAELALTRRTAATPAFSMSATSEAYRLEAASRVDAHPKPEAAPKTDAAPKSDEAPATPLASPFQNVHLKFKVDPKTNEVTVMMVDNASKRVVRTIPPDELRQMHEGDLVQLMA
jgi:hypothetical protein